MRTQQSPELQDGQAHMPPLSSGRAPSAGSKATSAHQSTPAASQRPRPRSGVSCCAPSAEHGEGGGPAWLLPLLPLACCGGPALIGLLAAIGAAAWGVLGGVLALVLGGVAVGLVRRRRRACAGGIGTSASAGAIPQPERASIGGAAR